ncbi:MAG: ROK family protein [Sulfobacillus acidophilus]|uniref:ROK family protein n=1 Tax=Sulfobacillus acidophilus TaxID=53633 RepID=A0A2T2WI19_9FIRM|nr:MAG: ROK family protein [Sulfobacillus acidophilus]
MVAYRGDTICGIQLKGDRRLSRRLDQRRGLADQGVMDYILGFDYGGTKVDVGVAGVDGAIVDRQRLLVADFLTLEQLMESSLAVGQALAADKRLVAVGVSTMGITHADHVDLAPNVPGWSTLHLPAHFHAAFPDVPVVIENDVRAACEAERRWGSLRDVKTAAYLNLGTGIAMAFVIGGRVYPGAHGAAGEIAYLWRADEKGFRDGHAPFEEQFGGGGLDRLIQRMFAPWHTLSELFDQMARPEVAAFLHETFREIARRVGHILLAYDVERVSVGGGIALRFDVLRPIFESEWQSHLPFPPDLVVSRFLNQAGLHGALALAAGRGAPA